MSLTPEAVPAEISKQLGPYLKRALELQDIKPIVSYYCKFYITDYIINNKLHLSSPDVANFTLLLLDNMEQCKAQLSELDMQIMQDSAASYDHVQEFAFSVFHKGYLDIVNHTTSKATVSVLKSSLEFMTILKYWGEPLRPEVLKNIKYAKFHISRVLKLYRANQDPNDYMTPEDKEMEQNIDQELATATLSTPTPPSTHLKNTETSPEPDLPKPPTSLNSQHPELPKPPSFIKDEDTSELPQPPTFINDIDPQTPVSPTSSPPLPPPVVKPQEPARKISKLDIAQILSTEEKIEKTQKLCKFAISALNYEDMETAKLELRKALAILES